MPGGHRTHDYPYGKPFPLVLVNIAGLVVGVFWVILASGSWTRAIGILALFLALGLIDSKLHQAYERNGQAVPIPREITVVKFASGMPSLLLVLRAAFLVFAAALVGFGLAPLRDAIAKIGMIGSVVGLVLVGVLHVALEHYYVRTGRGKEAPVGLSRSTATPKSPNQH